MTRPGGPNIIATMTDKALLEPAEYARLVIDVASEKQASDILMLDMAAATDFTDYFVIVSVDSTRQMRALVEDIEHAMEGSGAMLHHREGGPNSGWRLLDFGDVIVHIFGAEERDYYRIEGAWPEAVEVVRIQ